MCMPCTPPFFTLHARDLFKFCHSLQTGFKRIHCTGTVSNFFLVFQQIEGLCRVAAKMVASHSVSSKRAKSFIFGISFFRFRMMAFQQMLFFTRPSIYFIVNKSFNQFCASSFSYLIPDNGPIASIVSFFMLCFYVLDSDHRERHGVRF